MINFEILPGIESPKSLRALTDEQLVRLTDEIREALCNVVSTRSAHFASNLGVVELAVALHLVFDFSKDRLIWDTGHQIYPHKLLTGRFREFDTIRTKGGLMGYPESRREPLRPVHDGTRRRERLDRAGPQGGRRFVARRSFGRRSPRRRRAGRRGPPLRHRVRGDEQRGRPEKRPSGHPQRQQDGHLPARRRAGSVSRQGPRRTVLRRAQARHRLAAQQGARRRRVGRAHAGPVQGRGQDLPARRHAVRGNGLSLHRPGRRTRPAVAAELPRTGERGQRPRPVARLHREGPRLQAGLRRSGPLPHAPRLPAERERRDRLGEEKLDRRPTPTWPATRFMRPWAAIPR